MGQPGCFGDLVGGSAPTLRSIYLAESLAHVAAVLGATVGEPGFDEVLSDSAGRALWVTSRTLGDAGTRALGAAGMRSLGRAPWSPRTPVVRVEV